MKRIDILKPNDFKLLEKLVGNEAIYLKILMKNMPDEMQAIDLSQYHGTITVSFEQMKFRKIKVETDSWDNVSIFKNVGKATIAFQENMTFLISYYNKNKKYAVKNEQDLRNAISLFQKGQNVIAEVERDFSISNGLVIPDGFSVHQNKCNIYVNSLELQEKFKKIKVDTILCDKIIRIDKKEHFTKLNTLEEGHVYVEIIADIKDEIIPSISLKDFTGKLCIDGQGHVMSHCTIENGVNGGLITDIHPQGTLVINNFHMENCRFLGTCNYSGAFLGSRVEKKGYASIPAPVVIANCSVKKCKFTRANYNGALIGKWDEFISILNCYHSDNFTRKGNIKFPSASDGSFGMIYSYISKNQIDKELQLFRKK